MSGPRIVVGVDPAAPPPPRVVMEPIVSPPPPPSLPRINVNPLAPPPPRVIYDGSQHRAIRTPRPKGVHTKHLTELERFRVRTLYYDAGLTKSRIREITGYSTSQIRTAVRAKSATIGRRPGRPRNPFKKVKRKSGG
jgi:hypothetical protein